jgi:hypothetical protein
LHIRFRRGGIVLGEQPPKVTVEGRQETRHRQDVVDAHRPLPGESLLFRPAQLDIGDDAGSVQLHHQDGDFFTTGAAGADLPDVVFAAHDAQTGTPETRPADAAGHVVVGNQAANHHLG